LAQLVGSGFGNSAATRFASMWGAQNGYLIDYTIGLVTHNRDKSNSAASALVGTFVPQVAQLISNMTQLPLDLVTRLENQQVTGSKAVIDDVVQQNYVRMYADLRATYADSPRLADLLAARMVQKFPDKFPGDPSDQAVSQRVAINGLLQEHAYLMTMSTDAYVEARGADGAAASNALAANASALERSLSAYLAAGAAPRFDNLWKLREFDLLSYANWGDTVARRWLTDTFAPQFSALLQAPAETVRDQVVATIKVIDDQRTRALTGVAADDQSAAAAMQAIADRIALPSP
jgi:hypothetical protein